MVGLKLIVSTVQCKFLLMLNTDYGRIETILHHHKGYCPSTLNTDYGRIETRR